MKKKVFLRAYLNDNFGDDLFVQIISARYPDTEFCLQMSRDYGARFPKNIIAGLHFCNRLLLKGFSVLDQHLKTTLRKDYFCRIGKRMSEKADESVYLIGSGFIERNFSEKVERKRELVYYKNSPYVLGCNFGPYLHENYLKLYKELFSYTADLCFRDSYSAGLFKALPQTRREADVVFAYDQGHEKILPEDFGPYVLLSVVSLKKCRDELSELETAYIAYLYECIALSLKQNKKVVLVGFCKKEHDDEVIEKLMLGQDRERVVEFQYPDCSYKEVMGLFADADSVIACRYHAMIIGFLYRKPVYVLAYSDKTVDALKDIDPVSRCLRVSNITRVSPETFLKDYMCRLSDERLKELQISAKRQFSLLDQKLE